MIKIYTDGSYMNTINPGVVGWGCVIVYDDGIVSKGKGICHRWVDSHNVAGECAAVIHALRCMIEERDITDEYICIYHDYEGIAKWITGEWDTKKDITKWYRNKFLHICNAWNLHYTFMHVQAHSGDEYNELADQLAKEAIIGRCTA